MRVLEKHEPAISNHCILCGNGLDRIHQDIVIDVGRDMDLPGHQMDGRLFVCQGCVFDIARAAGLLTATQLDETKAYLRRYRSEVEELHERVIGALLDASEYMRHLPSAPNLDHLDSPHHVLVAEENATRTEREQRDWVSVDDGNDPPF